VPKIPTGNPNGRPKGAEGASRRELRHLLNEWYPDWHPALQLATLAQDPESSKELQASCAKEVLQYICPKLRSIDHTSEDGSGLQITIVDATKRPE